MGVRPLGPSEGTRAALRRSPLPTAPLPQYTHFAPSLQGRLGRALLPRAGWGISAGAPCARRLDSRLRGAGPWGVGGGGKAPPLPRGWGGGLWPEPAAGSATSGCSPGPGAETPRFVPPGPARGGRGALTACAGGSAAAAAAAPPEGRGARPRTWRGRGPSLRRPSAGDCGPARGRPGPPRCLSPPRALPPAGPARLGAGGGAADPSEDLRGRWGHSSRPTSPYFG